MSLVYFNCNYTDSDKSGALIKEKTGLDIVINNSSYGFQECSVKFPDMENYETLTMMYLNNPDAICFVDVENHFFAYAFQPSSMGYYDPGSSITDSLRVLIHEKKDGSLVSELTSSSTMNWYQYFNISYTVNRNATTEQITLVPAFAQSGKCFIKNLYINYERMFSPALKFIDQNGNRFVTIGGYLLYKVD